jgi:putative ABC transport system ATP-binding protein
LFSGLLVLAYRPLREAARHFPRRLQAVQESGDFETLLRDWEKFPRRSLPDSWSGSSNGEGLALREVFFGYASGQPVFQGFSAEFGWGAVTGIAGPNGAGKTTLLRLLAGVEIPESGKVLWPEALRRHGAPAYLPQRVFLGGDSGLRLRSLAEKRPELWARLNVLLRLERLLPRLEQQGESLSGGEKQRLALALTLSSGAPFLLLDEPTTALPADERERVLAGALEIWAPRGAVVVSHEPFLAGLCHHFFSLQAADAIPSAGKRLP